MNGPVCDPVFVTRLQKNVHCFALLSIYAGGLGSSAESARPLCTTKACVTAASSILNSLDESIDPCEDFYQYACGGWIRSHPIPSGESRWDTFGVLRRKNQLVLKNLLGKRRVEESTVMGGMWRHARNENELRMIVSRYE